MAKVSPFPLNEVIVEDLVMEMSPAGLARVFSCYHIEVLEAMIKQAYPKPGKGESIHLNHLYKKLRKAWNIVYETKRKRR